MEYHRVELDVFGFKVFQWTWTWETEKEQPKKKHDYNCHEGCGCKDVT